VRHRQLGMRGLPVTPGTDSVNAPVANLPARVFRPPQEGLRIQVQDRIYTIGRLLWNGSFGAVYECTDEWGNSLVAKVIMPCDRAYDEVRAAWEGEYSTLYQLRHPNITYIHDCFEFQDTFYLVLERSENSFSELLNESWFDGEIWFLPLAKNLLSALHFIHRYGYVHKDIHPGNVFVHRVQDQLCPENFAFIFKIGDLGIARREAVIRSVGTILAEWILPPEVLNPAAFGSIGRQIDIYHAALLLTSLLLKRVPSFTRPQIVAGEPRQLAEKLSSPFAPALAKALRRRVEHRTKTAKELWDDLRGCI